MLGLLERVVETAERTGAAACEVFGSSEEYTGIISDGRHVNFANIFRNAGAGLRVFLHRDGGFSVGFAYVTNLSQHAMEAALNDALKIAKTGNQIHPRILLAGPASYKPIEGILDQRLNPIDPESICALTDQLFDGETGAKPDQSVGVLVRAGRCNRYIVNSRGVRGEYASSVFVIESHAKVWSRGQRSVAYDTMNSASLDPKMARACIRLSLNSANKRLEKKNLPQRGPMDLVLGPKASSQLISVGLLPMIVGSQRHVPTIGGRTLLSRLLSVVDDSLLPYGVGSRVFDDEGNPGKTTYLIKEGVIQRRLHNCLTAEISGEPNTSSAFRGDLKGHLWRPFYSAEPTVGPSNLLVKESQSSTSEEPLGNSDRGLFAKEFTRISSDRSGGFNATINDGFWVENGEIKHAIKNATIRENYVHVFQMLEGLASDSRSVMLAGYMSAAPVIVTPSLAFREVDIQ